MTYLGYIMLPVGLAGLFLSKKWLYRCFVFWTLFSASSVINVGEAENGSAVQVWMLFGALWLLRMALDALGSISWSFDRRILRPCAWFLMFLAVSILSLIMPFYINGRLSITSPILLDGSVTPLFLTWHNVTQVSYLGFGVLLAICVAKYNLCDDERHETERVILLSGICIAAWGVVQFICSVTGVPYPDYIFNNSGSPFGRGFLEVLESVGINRVSSATLEPSVLALDLIALLPLTFGAWIGREPVLSRAIDRGSTILFVVVLILSTSSTAYLGLPLLGFLLLIVLVHTRSISMARAATIVTCVTATVLAAALLVAAFVPIVGDILSSTLLDKAATYSALERSMTIGLAYEYFVQFPLLGIGWGSAVSHDLVVLLLSNVGIIGALVFTVAIWQVVRSGWHRLEPLMSSPNISITAWFLSLTAFLAISVFSGFPLVLGNFWLVVGMAIATSSKAAGKQEHEFGSEPAWAR